MLLIVFVFVSLSASFNAFPQGISESQSSSFSGVVPEHIHHQGVPVPIGVGHPHSFDDSTIGGRIDSIGDTGSVVPTPTFHVPSHHHVPVVGSGGVEGGVHHPFGRSDVNVGEHLHEHQFPGYAFNPFLNGGYTKMGGADFHHFLPEDISKTNPFFNGDISKVAGFHPYYHHPFVGGPQHISGASSSSVASGFGGLSGASSISSSVSA